MINIEAVMADFAVRQAERQVQVAEEIQQLSPAKQLRPGPGHLLEERSVP